MTSLDQGDGADSADRGDANDANDVAIDAFETFEGDELDAAESAALDAAGIEPSDDWFESIESELDIAPENVDEADAIHESGGTRAGDVATGLAIAGLIGGISLAGPFHDSNHQFTNPVTDAALASAGAFNEGVSALGEEKLTNPAEDTDVRWEPSTSLEVDPPSWMSNPTEVQASINEQLAASRDTDDASAEKN